MAFLGDTFVKADGSTVDLAFVTRGKIVVVLYTAGIIHTQPHLRCIWTLPGEF